MACLIFTVSGGLEGLAEDDVRRLLSGSIDGGVDQQDERKKTEGEAPAAAADVLVRWRTRGNSGSQLEVNFGSVTTKSSCLQKFIISAVTNLRFVEYAYLQLLSTKIDASSQEDILVRIQQAVSSRINTTDINTSLDIGRQCQNILQDRNVGLEKLPGKLLPTPEVDTSSVVPVTQPTTETRGFVVNTVYTREEVAKVVVEEYIKLIGDSFPSIAVEDVLFADAGTGSGALLRQLPNENSVGVDTHPNCNQGNILKADFLKLEEPELHQFHCKNSGSSKTKCLCIISNPPYADRSRGDYSAIVKFINKAIDLGSLCIGVIVPVKFARERIWASLGMNPQAKLLSRFLLPNNAFYDPSSGEGKHVSSVFLFFGLKPCDDGTDSLVEDTRNNACGTDRSSSTNTIHVVGRRDKGSYPWISTADFSASVAQGLEDGGTELRSSEEAKFIVCANIKASNTSTDAIMDLDLLLNPKRPLSLTNSLSRLVAKHSLGWISSSVKPPVACAMCRLATGKVTDEGTVNSVNTCGLLINAMSGEGTIELEAQSPDMPDKFFMISGDKDASAAVETSRRLASIHKTTGKRPRVDMIVWDAQRLPLRRRIADAYVADLPFAGSKKKAHQVPSSSGSAVDASLDYKVVMGQAITALRTGAHAVLLSADAKAMGYASRAFNWSERWQSNAVNVGGLSAKLCVLERGAQCWKDLSMWVEQDCVVDLSGSLLPIAREACSHFSLDNSLVLQKGAEPGSVRSASLVECVKQCDTYVNKENMASHGYRFFFDDRVSNQQAKVLYKVICSAVAENPPGGMLPPP